MASTNVTLRVWRGDAGQGELTEYEVLANEGEVVLDILHRLQATQAGDLAVRWNCKAGKCGSCSMEINGRPRLACMTRMNLFEPGEPITLTPVRTFPEPRPHLPAKGPSTGRRTWPGIPPATASSATATETPAS